MTKPTVFISYSHADEAWKDKLVDHLGVLQQEGLLTFWHDRQIKVGQNWFTEIEQAMESATVAVLMISAKFLTSDFILKTEIKHLLERRALGGLQVFPLIIKPCAWQKVSWLTGTQAWPINGVSLLEGGECQAEIELANFAAEIHDLLEQQTALPPIVSDDNPTFNPPQKTDLSKLPNTGTELFGREDELKLLDDAWQDRQIGVVSFIAWGGVGKSALINRWLKNMKADNYRGATKVYGWSFYSQGTKDNRQVSADTFINAAFKWFDQPEDKIPTGSHEKGALLAQLISKSKTLLILDGLEPMQFPPGYNDGKLKDQSISALLKNLADNNQGLCVITSRKTVEDLKNSDSPSHKLSNLSVEAGVKVLTISGIKGPQSELEKAVLQSNGHALALNLLGSYLSAVHDGDIRQRDKIESIYDDEENGSHARNVMVCYEKWFAQSDKPELDILTLLGLFDRPASKAAIDVLKAEPAISGVSERLQNISFKQWQFAIKRLRELQLLAQPENEQIDSLDCHPLIREHFGSQLQLLNPEAFKAAHARLYEYYKALPEKELPDTLQEMEPLFIAVTHGCLAGQYQEVFDEVVWQRICRERDYYILRQLGAFDSFISVLSNFFAVPWQTVHAEFDSHDKAILLGTAGGVLRAVGRLFEATQPMKASLDMFVEQEDWQQSAINASNLSELSVTLGEVTDAVKYGEQSVTFADKSDDGFEMEARRTVHADALFQSGEDQAAQNQFIEAEAMQQKRQPGYTFLYSIQGYRFCELLLALGQYQQVLKRAQTNIEISKRHHWLLHIALDQLTIGKALKQQVITETLVDFTEAQSWFDKVITGLRQAGQQDYLPLGLLARADLHRLQNNFTQCWTDLDETRDIASHSSMLLHLTDYHLSACRTINAQLAAQPEANSQTEFSIIDNGKNLRLSKAELQTRFTHHLTTATELVNQTGYHRRDDELIALQQ